MRIWDKYCCYCGKPISEKSANYTKEHLIPKSKGGNNLPINKKPCCKTCNGWRGNQSLEQFKISVQYHLNLGLNYKEHTSKDFEIMIENIDYWINYVLTSGNKLKRKDYAINQTANM